MNAWKFMSRELYIGNGDATRIDANGPNLTVTADMDILQNGEWVLAYKSASQELVLSRRRGLVTTFLSIPVPRGTELKKLMLTDAKTIPSSGGPNQNFRDIYTFSTTSVNADHVLLTNYGDILILDNYDRWNTKIFWSAFKQFLINKDYVYSQYPNHSFSDRNYNNTNITPLINGKKFKYDDNSTWSWNIIDIGLVKHSDGYFNLEKYTLQPNQFVYIKIGTGDWYNALYLTNNDLQMFTFNWSNIRNRTDTTQIATNRATLSWRLSDILKKLGENVSLNGIQNLIVKDGKFILSGSGTSVIYTIGEGIGTAKYLAITTNGDLILLSSDGRTIIYSFFAWLVDKVVKNEEAKKSKEKQEVNDRITRAADITNLQQPVLTDTNKSYRVYISSATYTCFGYYTFNILGWFTKYLKDNVKTTDDFKAGSGINKDKKIWKATYNEFGCPSSDSPSMTIKWTFNGTEKEQTFKNNEDIILTFTTSCIGGYDVCTDSKQKWVKTYDPFPSGTCDVKADIPCTTPSTTPPSTTPPSTTPPSTTPPSTTPPSTTPPSTTPPSTTPPSTTPPSTTPPSTTPPSTTPPSTTPPSVEPYANCVGKWSEFGDCKDGKKTKTYEVTKPASGGGMACKHSDGETTAEKCSYAWYKNPLILAGIGGGILLLIIMIMMFSMGDSSPVPVPDPVPV
jgi:hypothetical protein